ncbi:leucine-rich repeat domain-containing protein [uncultured Microscilla sp.]|uniref:leucine-rich repeat domain-containing protein n=1 Tax=uncultured Microscilla sp. TaxID=432653 RepID=UPI00260F5024|nr:leucine-rich repeat domain-containing protein [uncultured Microscilla sp.]
MDLSSKSYTKKELDYVQGLWKAPEDGFYTIEHEKNIRKAFEILSQKGVPQELKETAIRVFPIYCLEYELVEFESYWKEATEIRCYFGYISVIPKNIGKLKKLEGLFLGRNQIKEVPPQINELKSLKSLDLTKNKISSLPEEIGELGLLENFAISDNYIENLPKSFSKLQNLQYLSMQNMKPRIRTIFPEVFLLKKLKRLILNENNIREIPSHISNLQNIQKISLSENNIRHIPIELYGLPNLESIDLYDNPLAQDEVSKLMDFFGERVALDWLK